MGYAFFFPECHWISLFLPRMSLDFPTSVFRLTNLPILTPVRTPSPSAPTSPNNSNTVPPDLSRPRCWLPPRPKEWQPTPRLTVLTREAHRQVGFKYSTSRPFLLPPPNYYQGQNYIRFCALIPRGYPKWYCARSFEWFLSRSIHLPTTHHLPTPPLPNPSPYLLLLE